jgi:pantoate--beta-alanine ligase
LTVVKRLFESVRPDIAIFGEKDFQQLFLIKGLAKRMGIVTITHPTVRDENGLALSSRNRRLSKAGRDSASVIYRALIAAKDSSTPKRTMEEILRSESAFTIDYAEVIDEESFEVIDDGKKSMNRRALIAGWIEGIRLIDTISLGDRS